jgi:nucleotide-binding universal stress UspA family protein/RimJ/RimL family protein N-acetyltransferase
MSTPSRRKTVTLRDGARVVLRPIAPEDRQVLAASFDRLSEESRYRRFLTSKDKLSAAELDYLVDVDHKNHEAIVAIDPVTGEGLGVARYVRSGDDAELAEVAVTVADDWQGRGLGRALLGRLTYRARREGVRRFSALVQGENRASLGLLEGAGETRRRWETGQVELVIELPPERGMGARLAGVLRAAAAGSLVPAQTVVHRVAVGIESSASPAVPPGLPIETIVVGADGLGTAAGAFDAGVRLASALGAEVHVVSAYGALQTGRDAEEVLAEAARAAREEGLEAVTHRRRGDAADALIAVSEELGADLLVVGSRGMGRASRSRLANVADKVSHHAPCSILIVRTDE